MKNRCQVLVEQAGKRNPFSNEKPYEETHMLSTKLEGTPEYMIPVFTKAYVLSEGGWDATQASKVLTFLKAADPGQFAVEDTLDLHGDIGFFYILRVRATGNRTSVLPQWKIEVYTPARKWFDAQISRWEMEEGVSGIEDEPVILTSFNPYDYKDCVNQHALRRVGTAVLKMIGDKPFLELTKQLKDRLHDYSVSG